MKQLKCLPVCVAVLLACLTLLTITSLLNITWASFGDDQQSDVKSLIREKGCGSCHQISGISSANSLVGPTLAGYAKHIYIAGLVPNNRQNLTRWLLSPEKISPDTAMPDTRLTIQQAEAIADYLLGND